MRYWWVSQNQTFQHEVSGGYLWSPKTKRDGAAYTCPKPMEFGPSGANWNEIGWRINASFQILANPVRPRDHMELIGPVLSKRYSPIRSSGVGNQMYLTEISSAFGQVLVQLIGIDARAFIANRDAIVLGAKELGAQMIDSDDLLKKWDNIQIEKIEKDHDLSQTEKEQVIKSRQGQGVFRNRVSEIENHCRITNVDKPEHLIASHIKPWKVSSNKERLDGENGLLLTPSIDHLFDQGYISFRNSGTLLISPTAHLVTLIKMGIPRNRDYHVGTFTHEQARYLDYHRDSIFLKARG